MPQALLPSTRITKSSQSCKWSKEFKQWWRVTCIYNFAVTLQSVFKHSYNRTLDHSGMSHDVAARHDVERLEQATEYSSNNWESFVEGLASSFLTAHRGIKGYPFCMFMHCLQILQSKCYYMWNASDQCGPIEATKVRYHYGLFNT